VLPVYDLSVQPLLPDFTGFYRLIIGLGENIINPARQDGKPEREQGTKQAGPVIG
jgi:hypothetical protein